MFRSRNECGAEEFVIVLRPMTPRKKKKRRRGVLTLLTLALLWCFFMIGAKGPSSQVSTAHPTAARYETGALPRNAAKADPSGHKNETRSSYCAMYPAKCR